MRFLIKIFVLCSFPSTVFSQSITKEYVLECIADISAIHSLSSALRDTGYDVSIENISTVEDLRKKYITIGVLSGVLDENNSELYLEKHQENLKNKIEGMKTIIMRRGEVGALNFLAERHGTECSPILAWKP